MPSSSFFSGTNPTPTEYENAVDLVAQASAQATAALASANTATTASQSAQGYSVSAGTSAETATQQAAAAATSAAGALASQNAAATSATAASSSATSASSSASNAATSATNASNSATSASGSATSAGTYATNAANSATAAANSASDAAATLANALVKTNNLSDLSNKSTSRSNLGVAIGSDVQAWDADLDAIAAISSTSGLLKKTAANTWSLDTTSYLSGTVGLANGGTGATDAAGARTALGLGTAATAAATSFAQVANNLSDLVSASTARSNLGLGSVATLASTAVLQSANNLSDLGNVTTARTNLGLSALATTTPGTGVATALTNATNGASGVVVLDGSGKLPALDGSSLTGLLTTVNNSNWSGTQLAIANGGTGATTASGARTNLGLSTVAATGAYSDLSGTPTLATVATTGAYSDLSGKPTLGSLAALSSINNSYWSGTQLSVANGGTGLTSLTAGYIPYGNGTSAFSNSANLTYSGTVLTAVGEIYASQAATNTQQIRLSPQSSGSNIIYSTYAGTNSYLPLVFNVGGSDRLTIDTAGNLGLGVTPSAWWSVFKAFEQPAGSLSSFYGSQLFLSQNAYYSTTGGNSWKYVASSAQASQYLQYAGQHIWFTAPSGSAGGTISFTQAMTLDASGNLGVGTPSPGTKLDVNGASRLQVDVSTTTPTISSISSDTYSFQTLRLGAASYELFTGGSIKATLDASGTLIVNGTSNPYSSVKSLIFGRAAYVANSEPLGLMVCYSPTRYSSGQVYYIGATDSATPDLVFSNISNVEKLRLTDSGNLLVGTTTSAAKLTVVPASSGIAAAFGTGSGLNYISVGSGNATTYHTRFGYDVTNEYGYIQAYAASGVADDIMICPSGGELRVGGTTDQGAYNLQCNGTGVWGAGAYVNGSDERLKEQIQDIQPCLEVVRSLRPVTFKYKADYSKDRSIQPGFLAQELQAALGKQAYVDGIVSHGPTYLNVAYQSIIPVLTKAIQELAAKVTALEAANG